MTSLIWKLSRKKQVSFDNEVLPRVLSLFDLTLLGIGSTVGVGFYILAGQVARNVAGPAVTISFLIAGIASVFAGLCYAEFGARVPKAGSAYVYSYVSVGEFIAFIIGWNLILEYVIGTASVARGFSGYINELANSSISNAFDDAMHMDSKALAPYPDFLAFGMVLLIACVLCIGVKESSAANNVFTSINLFVIAYSIIACSTKADIENWQLTDDQVNMTSNETVCLVPKVPESEEDDPWGDGGFSPYGFDGIMQGAATCFFGFVGFDVIATTGEEALNPSRNIPWSILLSLAFIFASYFGLSVVLTLALPYCMQDADAPLIELFNYYDMNVSKWIVSTGAVFGFSASLFGVMFPMPRIIYAMAEDGMLFRVLSRVNQKFKTPIFATLVSSILAAVMALLLSLESLVNMMSIGTLMAYTIVALCVMLLRYTELSHSSINAAEYVLLRYSSENDIIESSQNDNVSSTTELNRTSSKVPFKQCIKLLLSSKRFSKATNITSQLANYLTMSFFVFTFVLSLLLTVLGDKIAEGDIVSIIFVVLLAVLSIINLVLLNFQPQAVDTLHFHVPLVPWLPGISVFINLYLMCNLPTETWIRFVIWMAIGLLLYFTYGIQHSSEEGRRKGKILQENINRALSQSTISIPPITIDPPSPADSFKTKNIKPTKRVSICDSVISISRENSMKDYKPNYEKQKSLESILRTPQRKLSGSSQSSAVDTKSAIIDSEMTKRPSKCDTTPLRTENEVSAVVPYINKATIAAMIFSKNNPRGDGEISSEPNSPANPRHHTKVLKRGSSFDNIPPSSPDSPFARRVKNFVIIPVEKSIETNSKEIHDD